MGISNITDNIEKGDKFIARRHAYNIAVVEYRSVDGGVGYRIKGARRIYFSTLKNFRRNWTPIEADDDPTNAQTQPKHPR